MSEIESTARLFSVILCVFREDLRSELAAGTATDPSSTWQSKLEPLVSRLGNGDLADIQTDLRSNLVISNTMTNLRLLTEGRVDWVAGDCPNNGTINAMINAAAAALTSP